MKELLNSGLPTVAVTLPEVVRSGPGSMLDPDFLAAALGHPTRLQALVLFEQRPASSRELAAIVGLSASATQYHVKQLHKAGLIEQVDSRRRRAFEERIWRTSSTGWIELERQVADVWKRSKHVGRPDLSPENRVSQEDAE